MRTRLLVFALMTILVAGSLHAEQLPEENDVRSALETARAAGHRIGLELRNRRFAIRRSAMKSAVVGVAVLIVWGVVEWTTCLCVD